MRISGWFEWVGLLVLVDRQQASHEGLGGQIDLAAEILGSIES